MKIIKDTIIFKSSPEYYEKEKSGCKNNTCRTLESIEKDGYTLEQVSECKKIIIRNSETERQFEREITDITVFENIVIFSWADPLYCSASPCKRREDFQFSMP